MDNFRQYPEGMMIVFQDISRLRININEELMSKGHVECDHEKLFVWIDKLKENLEKARKYKHGRKKEIPTEEGRAEENKKTEYKGKRKRRKAPRK